MVCLLYTSYKRNSKKGQDRGVYGAWRLWLEEGPGPEEEPEQEEGLRPGEGPGPEENPDREEGLITVGVCSIPAEAAHSISLKSLKLSLLMERLRGEARHLPIHEPVSYTHLDVYKRQKESMEHPEQKYLVVVPEQFTMQTQKEIIRLHPRHGIMNCLLYTS